MSKTHKTPTKNNKTPIKRLTSARGRSLTPSLKALENLTLEDRINEIKSPPRTKQVRRTIHSITDTPTKEKGLARKPRTIFKINDKTDEFEDENVVPNENYKSELFFLDVDVDGKQVYGFSTPKKRDSMLKLALNTPKTPKTITINEKTPLKRHSSCNLDAKRVRTTELPPQTPRHVRSAIKKEISRHVKSFSESDFSEDNSEFLPDSSSDIELSDENSENSKESDDSENQTGSPLKNKRSTRNLLSATPTSKNQLTTRNARRLKLNEFVPECEEYFNSQSNRKIVTSNHTLDRLKTSRLPADLLFKLLKSLKLSTEHEYAITDLINEYRNKFTNWMFRLSEGFSILLYGLGSKRTILQNFIREMLSDRIVIVVNGYFPSLTIKDIVDSILIDILKFSSSPSNLHEAVNVIEDKLISLSEAHIFLIVHNIDGPMLRNSKAQDILSRLAKIRNIHLLASIDHMNTPLLWDHTKLINYNFSWCDVTTMLPYSAETAFENSLLVQHSTELALSSMRNVFASLTSNGKGIFMVLVKYQLKNKGNSNYQGMLFKDLYWGCRDAFLVSSDIALRAQLTEFLDHKLIKSKRNNDGSETLKIPIKSELLVEFLEEHKEK